MAEDDGMMEWMMMTIGMAATAAALSGVNEPSSTPSAATPGASSGLLQRVIPRVIEQHLRKARQPHISWHTVLHDHATQRPKAYGGPLCASIKACKKWTQVGSMHSCRIVLPNSYAPDDGKVVEAEASAPDKHTAGEDAACAAFALLCADKDGLPNVIFRHAHWNAPTEALIREIGRIVDPSATFEPHAVRQRAAASGAMVVYRIPEANLQRAADLIRLCLRAHDGSSAPSKVDHKTFVQVAGRQEKKVYAQLAGLLPLGGLRQFIEQHPEFDIDEKEGLWYIKWRFAAPQRPPLAAFCGRLPAASGAPSASASGAPSDVQETSGPETRVFPDGGDRAHLRDF